jgi:prevent-host-death family protein
MMRVTASEAREKFADVLTAVRAGRRVLVRDDQGQPVAAVVPIADLKFLRDFEDRHDGEIATVRSQELAEGKVESIPLEQVRRELGR